MNLVCLALFSTSVTAYSLWMWFLRFFPGCTCQLEGIADWIFLHLTLLSDRYSTSSVIHTNTLVAISCSLPSLAEWGVAMQDSSIVTHSNCLNYYSSLHFEDTHVYTCIIIVLVPRPNPRKSLVTQPKFLGLGSAKALASCSSNVTHSNCIYSSN